MSKLAGVEKILKLTPIEGADRIECADILGWKCVVKKGEFKENDLCVFHFPDCIVDETNPAYSFLKDKRLKVVRLKKQVSQGLALPISLFNIENPQEGLDVTDVVKIVKYEKPIPAQLAGKILGSFPSWLKKTDQCNLRSYPEVINELTDQLAVASTKYDGSSMTCYLKDEVFGVCSRNLDLAEDPTNSFWLMARKFNIEKALRNFRNLYPGDYAVQMECIGPGINGNNLRLTELSIRIFDLWSINHHKYAHHETVVEFCSDNNLPMVDVVWAGKFNFNLQDLISMANKNEYSKGVKSEGLVIKPIREQESKILGGRLSVKVISEDYCLEHKE